MKMRLIVLLSTLIFVSCQSYKELPFDKDQILKDVEKQRVYKGPQEGLSYLNAQEIMSSNNFELKSLKQKYEKLKSVTDIKTPLPNPSIELGQAIGSSIDEKSASKVQPFIGLGFKIPLGPRLARNDDLNEILKLSSYNNLVLTHRGLLLELRKVYSKYQLASSLLNKQQQLLKHLKLNYLTVNKMLELGEATLIDFNSAKIQYENMQIDLLETQSEIGPIKSELGRLLGKDIKHIKNLLLSDKNILPDQLLNLDTLKKKVIQSNFDLARLEMDYKVAEVKLKLELAKQYPDIEIGSSWEQEPGEKKKVFSLGVSLELPFFDRNQQGITEKDNQRKVILAEYNSSLNDTINKIDLLVSTYKLQKKKLDLIDNQILPLAKETVEKAEKAVKAGRLGVLLFLDLSKELYRQELNQVLVKRRLNEIILELESTVGESLIDLN